MKKIFQWTASVAVALFFLSPVIWLVLASFQVESRIFSFNAGSWLTFEGWSGENYVDAWRRASLGQALFVSGLQVVLICVAGLVVNSLAAYAFARLEFSGKEWLFGGIIALIILPVEVLAVPLLFTARDLGLTGGYLATLGGLTVPFIAKAFNIYFLRQHFLNLPTALEEAAVIDGAGVWRRFWSIALPTVRPALATVVVIDVLTHWGDFLWPLMVSTREETRTLQLGLANLFTQPPIKWGDILACAVIATLPVVLLFRWLQRYIVISDAQAGLK